MRYDVVLADLDDTLLDFTASARQALTDFLRSRGLAATEEKIERYEAINRGWWERFERGEIPREDIFPGRFTDFFEALGISGDPLEANRYYMDHLCQKRNLIPGARELLGRIHPHCEICLISNGVGSTQRPRIRDSGLGPFLDRIFLSEDVGFQKPDRRFFDCVFSEIGGEKRPRSIVLGDSLTSDMLGGRNAGLATCFFGDPARADGRCDYVITDLLEFPEILGL